MKMADPEDTLGRSAAEKEKAKEKKKKQKGGTADDDDDSGGFKADLPKFDMPKFPFGD